MATITYTMTILDDAKKVESDAGQYLEALGDGFKMANKGKTIIVFPYLKEHVVVDDPVKVNEITNLAKYQKAVSFIMNL